MKKTLKSEYEYLFVKLNTKGKTAFSKFFYNKDEIDFSKKIKMLVENYYARKGDYDFDEDMYSDTVRDTIRSYTRNKDSLIATYKEFDGFLRERGLNAVVEYPPIPVSNTFERLMFIAKYLQDKNNKISDLSEILLQSERTIEDDLNKLRGLDDDPLQICGKKFVIENTERSMGRITFDSTAHPLFLTGNLTQIITMLDGLKIMSEKPEYNGYAITMAMNIWDQLSDYAKNRIRYVNAELIHEDMSWYDSLDKGRMDSFYSERRCSSEGENVVLDCLKNSKECIVEYIGEEGPVFYENVLVKQYRQGSIDVEVGGERLTLELDRINRSSYYKGNMY